jgi:hypothetical protein
VDLLPCARHTSRYASTASRSTAAHAANRGLGNRRIPLAVVAARERRRAHAPGSIRLRLLTGLARSDLLRLRLDEDPEDDGINVQRYKNAPKRDEQAPIYGYKIVPERRAAKGGDTSTREPANATASTQTRTPEPPSMSTADALAGYGKSEAGKTFLERNSVPSTPLSRRLNVVAGTSRRERRRPHLRLSRL